jgi:hypothetical protein
LEKSVTTTKEAINKKLEELKTLWEETYKSDIDKLKAMLVTLWGSSDELTTLKTSITKDKDATTSADKDKTSETKDETKTDDKDKSWLRKQRDGVTSKEERKTNTRSNVARIAWGIGIVALAYKWIKWLFGSKKDKEEKDDTKTDDTKDDTKTDKTKDDKKTDDTKKDDTKTDDVESKVSKKVEDKASGRFDKIIKKIWF